MEHKQTLDIVQLITDVVEKAVHSAIKNEVGEQMKPLKDAMQKLVLNRRYTVAEAAVLLNKTPYTVGRYCREGLLKATKVGRTYEINQQDIDDFKQAKEIFPRLGKMVKDTKAKIKKEKTLELINEKPYVNLNKDKYRKEYLSDTK